MPTLGLISWKISAKTEMFAIGKTSKLTILTSNGVSGFLDRRRR